MVVAQASCRRQKQENLCEFDEFKDSRTAGATQRNLVEGREGRKGGREDFKSLTNFLALTHVKA